MGNNSWNGYERNCLFTNDGGSGQFVDIARAAGGDEIGDSRGVAIADFDGDGRLDIAINNNDNRPALYFNRSTAAGHYLDLVLTGSQGSNRDAVGARVRLTLDGKTLTRWVEAGSGYASQSAYPLHFGLAAAERVESLEILWPGGQVERIPGQQVPVNQRLHLLQGQGIVDGGEATPLTTVPAYTPPASTGPATAELGNADTSDTLPHRSGSTES